MQARMDDGICRCHGRGSDNNTSTVFSTSGGLDRRSRTISPRTKCQSADVVRRPPLGAVACSCIRTVSTVRSLGNAPLLADEGRAHAGVALRGGEGRGHASMRLRQRGSWPTSASPPRQRGSWPTSASPPRRRGLGPRQRAPLAGVVLAHVSEPPSPAWILAYVSVSH